MSKKQEKLLRQLTDQALRLAWKIAEGKDAPCNSQQPPLLEVARYESLKAFRSSALALRAIFKLESSLASASTSLPHGS